MRYIRKRNEYKQCNFNFDVIYVNQHGTPYDVLLLYQLKEAIKLAHYHKPILLRILGLGLFQGYTNTSGSIPHVHINAIFLTAFQYIYIDIVSKNSLTYFVAIRSLNEMIK